MADKDFIMDGVASRAIMDEHDNKANLSDEFIKDVHAEYAGTRLGRQELEGELLDAKSDEHPEPAKKTAARPRKNADAKPSS